MAVTTAAEATESIAMQRIIRFVVDAAAAAADRAWVGGVLSAPGTSADIRSSLVVLPQ
jgi:hypothetical protein